MEEYKFAEKDIKNAIDTLKALAISEMSAYDGSEFSSGRCTVYYEMLDRLITHLKENNLDLAEYGLDIDLDRLCPLKLARRIAGEKGISLDDYNNSRKDWINEFLHCLGYLSKLQREVIIYRFGLENGTPLSLSKIGAKMGITAERVRQLEGSAIETIIESSTVLDKEKIEEIRPSLFETPFKERQSDDFDYSLEGEKVKSRLKANKLSQSWLVTKLAVNGLKIDNSFLSLTLSGLKITDKGKSIIAVSNAIIDSYEEEIKGSKI